MNAHDASRPTTNDSGPVGKGELAASKGSDSGKSCDSCDNLCSGGGRGITDTFHCCLCCHRNAPKFYKAHICESCQDRLLREEEEELYGSDVDRAYQQWKDAHADIKQGEL